MIYLLFLPPWSSFIVFHILPSHASQLFLLSRIFTGVQIPILDLGPDLGSVCIEPSIFLSSYVCASIQSWKFHFPPFLKWMFHTIRNQSIFLLFSFASDTGLVHLIRRWFLMSDLSDFAKVRVTLCLFFFTLLMSHPPCGINADRFSLHLL